MVGWPLICCTSTTMISLELLFAVLSLAVPLGVGVLILKFIKKRKGRGGPTMSTITRNRIIGGIILFLFVLAALFVVGLFLYGRALRSML